MVLLGDSALRESILIWCVVCVLLLLFSAKSNSSVPYYTYSMLHANPAMPK